MITKLHEFNLLRAKQEPFNNRYVSVFDGKVHTDIMWDDSEENCDDFENLLKKIVVGYNVSFRGEKVPKVDTSYQSKSEIVINVKNVYITKTGTHKSAIHFTDQDDNVYFSGCNDIKIIDEDLIRKKEELKLKYKDIDPLGEEDWLDESLDLSDFEKGLNLAIIINERIEYDTIMVFLDKLGYLWQGDFKLLSKNLFASYKPLVLYLSSRKKVSLSSLDFYKKHINGYELIKPTDFLNNDVVNDIMKKKELRREELKLKNIDIDPLGEEDWLEESMERPYDLENKMKTFDI